MRVSRKIAEQNRKNVVETAGQLFREQGYDGIGIADLMKAAGMTHGGFYKQFTGKSDLVAEATEAALKENKDRWEHSISGATGDPIKAVQKWYLSEQHLKALGEGCSFAALASESPRQDERVQSAFAEAIREIIALIEGEMGDETKALRTLSTMVGAIVLARSVGDDLLASKILRSARDS
ncbi:TetR family transcriptional regulator [Pseudovibrio japonicus]|uniref:TetR family transcriptional regulator n=1 Tax=Pseudovibrio japonicus TaxID=366534 RepID=A0ABQ3E7U2_9HYPH|nr:TetR/AcrR family transcriptional regulator [Pseudovibrio japonicus]GHB26289.1 TetR family transcriptional regulator [Pseudovibrio japonicus]